DKRRIEAQRPQLPSAAPAQRIRGDQLSDVSPLNAVHPGSLAINQATLAVSAKAMDDSEALHRCAGVLPAPQGPTQALGDRPTPEARTDKTSQASLQGRCLPARQSSVGQLDSRH